MASAGIASGAIGMIGGFIADKERQKNIKAGAKFNKAVAQQDAAFAREVATTDAGRIRKRNRRFISRQKVIAAKSGVRLSGSLSDVVFDSALEGELNALDRIFKGDLTSSKARQRALLEQARVEAANRSLLLNPLSNPLKHTKAIFGGGSPKFSGGGFVKFQ